jgi:hypothetical protein
MLQVIPGDSITVNKRIVKYTPGNVAAAAAPAAHDASGTPPPTPLSGVPFPVVGFATGEEKNY